MVYSSIWKDIYYETTGSSIQFALSTDGSVIYNGKAYAKPNTSNIKINITNICENYLDSTLPDLTGFTGATTTNTYREFVLTLYNETTNTWTTGNTYGFLMNYDRQFQPNFNSLGSFTLNVPINGHYQSGQITASSVYSATTISYAQNDASYCGQYALLYLNQRGGWDSFLFEGVCKKSDSYSISQYRKNVDNKTTGFSSVRYMNIITPRWELNTGLLTDVESERFAKHLVSSNSVYLQDLVNGEIIPVIITDKTVDYRQHNDSSSPQPISYKVNIEASQEYRRK